MPSDGPGPVRSTLRWAATHGLMRAAIRRQARRGNPDAALLLDPDLQGDPFAHYERLREHRPFARGAFSRVSVHHDVCTEVLRSEDFGVAGRDAAMPAAVRLTLRLAGPPPHPGPIDPPSMLAVDPPDHTRYRRLVTRAFTARRVEALRGRTEEIAADLLDSLATANGRPVDLVERYASLLPVTVISEMLGVPTAMREQFLAWGVRDQFSQEQWDTFTAVRRFVDHEVIPAAAAAWDAAEMSWEVIKGLPRLGVLGDDITGYGCPGLGPLTHGLVAMELARGDGSLATFHAVQSGLAMKAIAMLGSEEQKQEFLPAMARLDLIGAFALTEPEHGSDSVSLETTARRDGDDWVIDGAKRWIGNGSIAGRTVVWARDVETRAVKGFVVDTSTPGYEGTVIPRKGSMRSVWQADIRLDGVRVPDRDRLPGGESFKDTGRVLATTRGTCAWMALGHATAAYDAALRYSLERTQFGRPLASFQIVQERLVKMLAELTGMQLYCMQIARLAEQGDLAPTIAGLAKMNNTRKARWVIAEARDLLGGNGILLDNHVIRHMADVESIHTFEGTETVQTLIVGREITGHSAFT